MAPKDYRKAPRPGETLGPTPAPEDRHLDIPDSLRWMDPSSNHNYQKAQAKRQQEDLQRLHKAQVAQPQPQESQQQPRIGQQQQSNPGRLPNIQYHSRYDVQHQYRPRGIDLPTHPPGALDEQISAPGQQQQRNRLKRDHTTMDQAQQDLWNKRIKFCEEERERDAEEKRGK